MAQRHKVEAHSAIPIPAVITTTLISCLLALINIGSSLVINEITSIAVSGVYSSYLTCCSLLLWRRSTGLIRVCSDGSTHLSNTVGVAQLVWGSWRLLSVFGIVNNAFACVYLTVLLFFSFWPPDVTPTSKTMDYAVLTEGAVVVFSIVYYFAWARKFYKGPVVEISL